MHMCGVNSGRDALVGERKANRRTRRAERRFFDEDYLPKWLAVAQEA